MTTAVPIINNSRNQYSEKTIAKMEESAENFPLYMAQMTNSNISSLFSLSTSSFEDSSNDDSGSSVFGATGAADPFNLGGLTGASSTDAFSSIFNSQGVGTDLAFLNPAAGPNLDDIKVQQTLKDLMAYSNITENKKWLGQSVNFIDPADQLSKTGTVARIDIENVDQPKFIVTIDSGEEIELTLDEMTALNAGVLS